MTGPVAAEGFHLEPVWEFSVNRYIRNIRPAGRDAGAGFIFGSTDGGVYRVGRGGELRWRACLDGRVADVLPLDDDARRFVFASGYEPGRGRNDRCTVGIVAEGGRVESTRVIEGIFELHPIREGILAGGVEGNVYLLSPELDIIWRAAAGSYVFSLTETNDGAIAAATIAGEVVKLDRRGRELGRLQLPDDAMRVIRVDAGRDTDGGPDLIVATSRFSLYALDDALRVLWHRLTPMEFNIGLGARVGGDGIVVGSAIDAFWHEPGVIAAYDLDGLPASAPLAVPHGVDTLAAVPDVGGGELVIAAEDHGRVALFRVERRRRETGGPPTADALVELLAGDDAQGRYRALSWAARSPELAADALRLELGRVDRPALFDLLWAALRCGARDAVAAALERFKRGEARGREPTVFRADLVAPLGAELVAQWERSWVGRIAAALEGRGDGGGLGPKGTVSR